MRPSRRVRLALLVGTPLLALSAVAGVIALGAVDGAPQWAVDFDTTLVEHLPDQVAPLLYRILGQGQYEEIHAVSAEPPAIQPGTQPPSGCRRPTIPARPGSLERVAIRSSALTGAVRDLVIYLPPSYSQHDAGCWRYPVLYLLDGWPGSAADWFTSGHAQTTADHLIQARAVTELIIVSADGNGGLHREPQWANAYDGSEMDETFLVHDVVGYVDHHFRSWADAQHRTIGGLSDGGFGAANIGLHHPELFGQGMALSGIYRAPTGWPFDDSVTYRRAYSPLTYIDDPPVTATARQQFWFLGAGVHDGEYFRQTRALDNAFARLRIPHVSKYWQGGHAWQYWGQMLGDALPYFDQRFSAPAGTFAAPAGPPEPWPGTQAPA
ncbi:MAG TPA: alpha/beta hydrolase-fold protein [Candidatus Sulfotelmatobacter sp.]|nr:alpha/beta hydrolase-fold protein [Candidatus Sulfotelmatobacter sp.]